MESRIRFDGRKQTVHLDLSEGCLPVLDICNAACCSTWDEDLSPAEHASGHYHDEEACRIDRKLCRHHYADCANRIFRMKKREDGACIHLGSDSRCTIYATRPQVCRSFSCRSGWILGGVHPLVEAGDECKKQAPVPFSDVDVFQINPMHTLRTVFAENAKIVFLVKQDAHCVCTPISVESTLQIDEDVFFEVIGAINGKLTLAEIRNCSDISLIPIEVFNEALVLLNRVGIIFLRR